MVGWTIVMIGIVLIGVVVVVFKRRQRHTDHIAYWQQQRQIEQRKEEAAALLPDSLAGRQKMDNVKASMERIDGELSRLTGLKGSVAHHTS